MYSSANEAMFSSVGFNLIFAQNIANNCAISFSSDLDIAQIVFGTRIGCARLV